MRYIVVLTTIRTALPRDERIRPESVICRCEFDDREAALRTTRDWTTTEPVQAGRERVRTIIGPSRSGLAEHVP